MYKATMKGYRRGLFSDGDNVRRQRNYARAGDRPMRYHALRAVYDNQIAIVGWFPNPVLASSAREFARKQIRHDPSVWFDITQQPGIPTRQWGEIRAMLRKKITPA